MREDAPREFLGEQIRLAGKVDEYTKLHLKIAYLKRKIQAFLRFAPLALLRGTEIFSPEIFLYEFLMTNLSS